MVYCLTHQKLQGDQSIGFLNNLMSPPLAGAAKLKDNDEEQLLLLFSLSRYSIYSTTDSVHKGMKDFHAAYLELLRSYLLNETVPFFWMLTLCKVVVAEVSYVGA